MSAQIPKHQKYAEDSDSELKAYLESLRVQPSNMLPKLETTVANSTALSTESLNREVFGKLKSITDLINESDSEVESRYQMYPPNAPDSEHVTPCTSMSVLRSDFSIDEEIKQDEKTNESIMEDLRSTLKPSQNEHTKERRSPKVNSYKANLPQENSELFNKSLSYEDPDIERYLKSASVFLPNLMLMNSFMDSHIKLLQNFVQMDRSLVDNIQEIRHDPVTLEATRNYIKQHSRRIPTFEECLEEIKRQG